MKSAEIVYETHNFVLTCAAAAGAAAELWLVPAGDWEATDESVVGTVTFSKPGMDESCNITVFMFSK